MKKTARFILRLMGWKVTPFTPAEKKYVLIVAPHTSAMDFVVGRLAFWTKDLPARFFIKKEFFFFPIGMLLKSLGGMPIDRKQAGNVVEQSAQMLTDSERLALIITPEGTRKYTKNWKKGFYYIARRAQVPVYTGILDYGKKVCDIRPEPLNLNLEIGEIMDQLATIYKGAQGKHPENFNF